MRRLLELCERHRLTGALDITSWGRSGRVEMRAGRITAVTFGALQSHAAMTELSGLRDGLFELHQELPRVNAGGQAGRLPLSAVVEQARARALSCRIEVVSRKQRAVITYRAGELEHLEVDGDPLPEGMAAADVLAPFERGQVQVGALPLSLHEPAEAAAAQASGAHQVSRPAGREDSRPARVAPPVPPAAREESRPNRAHAAPPPPPAAREDSRPNRVHAAPPPPPAARQDSRPNRAHAVPPPLPSAARQGSRPNRVHAAPPPAARQDSRPNRAPAAAGTRPVPRPRVVPVANPTLRPVPVAPGGNASIPVALGRAQADGPGPAGAVRPWLPNPDASGALASPRNALASRRELALAALLTVLVLSLLLIIGFVALRP